MRLTFAGDRKQDQTARLTNIRRDEVLDEIDVSGISTLANARNQTCSSTFSPTVEQRRVEREKAYPADHRKTGRSIPAHLSRGKHSSWKT